MGIFSKPTPIHTMFELPRVSKKDCYQVSLPNMNLMAFPDVKWLNWQMRNNQPPSYWWSKIFESENYWNELQVDVNECAYHIAYMAASLENLQTDEVLVQDLLLNAKFGVLSGIFERASQSTADHSCHPIIWNSIVYFNLESAGIEIRPKLPEISLLLRDCVTWAGLAFSKIPYITVKQVFTNWRK